MVQIKIENLTFSYPLCDKKVLENVNLEINSGEFVLICGKSGCGKTTLLRQLKGAVAPKGQKDGTIYFNGRNVDELSVRESAEKIGFVMQNPDNQIVTDKVWHELAFGLENFGLDDDKIRLRVAEMASYFGIANWFESNVNELSGGQKQLMNLASVMAMHPDVLILDEPTSQLDPVSAENFLSTIVKINKELGVTVLISEHRIEEIFSCVDRVVVMDNGKIIEDDTPEKIGEELNKLPEFVRLSVPTAMRIYSLMNSTGECPITVRDGRNWLSDQNVIKKNIIHEETKIGENVAVDVRGISFRYSKNADDIIKNLSIKAYSSELLAILGSNGVGKSTLFNIIAGILTPYSGKVIINSKRIDKYKNGELYKNNLALLPQSVQALFTSKSVELELADVSSSKEETEKMLELMKLNELKDAHPYDLSGGEQQRLALAKVLLLKPKILLMDEPTKGMDAEFKMVFSEIIEQLKNDGCSVIMISHDIEFCAKYADRCAMLFDKTITSISSTKSFFNENRFYTTAANRMSRGIIDGAVTQEDIILCLKEN